MINIIHQPFSAKYGKTAHCGNQVHWGALSIVAINAMMGRSEIHETKNVEHRAVRVEMLSQPTCGLCWLQL